MPASKKKWKIIRAVLRSIKAGTSFFVACKAAGINDGTWWNWRKKDPRLERLTERLLMVRVQYVEDAVFKSALSGSVQAQKYFLNNRHAGRWQEQPDIIINNDNSRSVTQTFVNAPDRVMFDDGEGDRRLLSSDAAPEGCSVTPQEELSAAEERIECQENRLP